MKPDSRAGPRGFAAQVEESIRATAVQIESLRRWAEQANLDRTRVEALVRPYEEVLATLREKNLPQARALDREVERERRGSSAMVVFALAYWTAVPLAIFGGEVAKQVAVALVPVATAAFLASGPARRGLASRVRPKPLKPKESPERSLDQEYRRSKLQI